MADPSTQPGTVPVPRTVIKRLVKYARAHPWRGDRPLLNLNHCLDTTAITEPGRVTRILFSLDYGYHASGWFANSEWERCYHLSISHPRPEIAKLYRANEIRGEAVGMDLETPTDDEARAWGRAFFGEHAPMAWFEPAASVFDPRRSPNVVHLRLYVDQEMRPFLPTGEPYTLRPWADGSSPAKVTEGRAGADVR